MQEARPKLFVLDTNVILHDSGCIRNINVGCFLFSFSYPLLPAKACAAGIFCKKNGSPI